MPPNASLHLIRAFVTVANAGNIKRAAEITGLTQSAVSKQILQLENALKVKLFKRTARGVILTEAGALIFQDCELGLKTIDIALGRIEMGAGPAVLVVACARSFATCVLSHYIGEFCQEHPWIDVRLDGYRHFGDLRRGEADVGIRVGKGGWPGVAAKRLCIDPLVPVCSPSLKSKLSLGYPGDFLRYQGLLLRFSDRPYWRNWAHHHGVDAQTFARGPVFSETVMMLEAAEAGQGIALGRASLVGQKIRAGRLVVASPYTFDDGVGYYLIEDERTRNRRANRLFREWIFDRVVPEMLFEIDG